MSVPPLVSVVMVTYRADGGRLKRAIESVLAQSVSDLELIVVFEKDDDNAALVRNEISDPRVILLVNEGMRHRNICHNIGLAAARGRYLARMDDDDYTYPDRLEKQLRFLAAHPDIVLVGGAGRLLDHLGRHVGDRVFPLDHAGIMRHMAVTNPILHPAVLWDRDKTGRDLRYAIYQVDDLELWLRMARAGHRFANLADILTDYTQPEKYRRPMKNWRGNFQVRALHWKAGLRYPLLLMGLAGFAVLAVLPRGWVDAVTQQGRLSDWFRSIRRI